MKTLNNIHPSEVLREEFLKPMQITAYALAKTTAMPQSRISALVNGKRRFTADTAIRLAKAFNMQDPSFWLRLQASYDLEQAQQKHQAEYKNLPQMI